MAERLDMWPRNPEDKMKNANKPEPELLPAIAESAPLARQADAEPTIGALMASVIESGIKPESVEVMKGLFELRNREQDRAAQRAFASAFSALQAEIPIITKDRRVINKDGVSERFQYATFLGVMRVVVPLLVKHGFSVSFDAKEDGPRITAACCLMHKEGHSQTNHFSVRIGSGPPGSTETQADGSAHTYAKRGALCDCLSIVTEDMDKENDARIIGGPVTLQQADELRSRVIKTNSNEDSFLRCAGAKTYEEIPAGKYAMLDEMLKRKESKHENL